MIISIAFGVAVYLYSSVTHYFCSAVHNTEFATRRSKASSHSDMLTAAVAVLFACYVHCSIADLAHIKCTHEVKMLLL